MEVEYSAANASFDGKTLKVSTGLMTREWVWTGHGLLTTSIESNGRQTWNKSGTNYDADWLLPTCISKNPDAELINPQLNVSNDEGFTSEHIEFQTEIKYASAKLSLKFIVWVWPNCPGIRVQLKLKAEEGFVFDSSIQRSETTENSNDAAILERGLQRLDTLPVDFKDSKRAFFGYYSDTQNRNDNFLDLLLEGSEDHPMTHSRVSEWSNAACVEKDGFGVALLKESHKCVNQRGHDTGTFVCSPETGLENHGWGIIPSAIKEHWQFAWASWSLCYETANRGRQTAFKQFDKTRYPMKENDIYLQANTWGSSIGHKEHRDAAGEASVMKEIEVCSELGIDTLQIDDGWQGDQYDTWKTVAERYPKGWENVKALAKEKNINLGLWLAALPPSLEDLVDNAKDGDFKSFKLDFAILKSRDLIDSLIKKVRDFVKAMDHKVRVNWDLTEVCARYGFYFAREFGCIYLENRKPVVPKSTTYRPSTVLRDLWQISKYCNLLKFQGSTQNIDRVNPHYSDAGAYSHDYCLAITLMSSPLYFCEMKFFSDEAKSLIKPLIAEYKKVRGDIVKGITYPIGEKPNGSNWTGFENKLNEQEGYFMLFREPYNSNEQGSYLLEHLQNKNIEVENLMSKDKKNLSINEKGELNYSMKAGTYAFLKYSIK